MSRRVLVVGNSGSGKSTYAKALASRLGARHIDLDPYAWKAVQPPERLAVEVSLRRLREELPREGWVVEGCYADLLAGLQDEADLLVFLNPGVEACVSHCRARPFEPHKYDSPEAQTANLEMLINWVRAYETRDGPMSLAGHRALFDGFGGEKRELTDPTRWG